MLKINVSAPCAGGGPTRGQPSLTFPIQANGSFSAHQVRSGLPAQGSSDRYRIENSATGVIRGGDAHGTFRIVATFYTASGAYVTTCQSGEVSWSAHETATRSGEPGVLGVGDAVDFSGSELHCVGVGPPHNRRMGVFCVLATSRGYIPNTYAIVLWSNGDSTSDDVASMVKDLRPVVKKRYSAALRAHATFVGGIRCDYANRAVTCYGSSPQGQPTGPGFILDSSAVTFLDEKRGRLTVGLKMKQ